MDTSRLRAPLNAMQTRMQEQRGQPDAHHNLNTPNVPQRAPQPSQPSANGAIFPAVNSSQRVGSRRKVALEPGCSPLDWARLNSSGKNLRGIDGRDYPLRVNKELLKSHSKIDDCWTVLKGRVYNITEYVRFHPGGVEEIMKCAGRDGTLLFMNYHAWVNYERMLDNCLVGMYTG